MGVYGAIDLGASSGRVAVGKISNGKIQLEVLHRFGNYQKSSRPGEVLWDWGVITAEIVTGIKLAKERYSITSVAVDTWAVDYVLFDYTNQIAAPTYAYRDDRTDGRMELVISDYGAEKIYRHTGIQFQPFNTIYQLLASKEAGELSGNRFLMMPDAINNFLCGSTTTEITNASSTQLLNLNSQSWDWDLISEIGLPKEIFPLLHEPKMELGVINGFGEIDGISVVAVGSHDTASAIAGVPLISPQSEIYISSGTWSLIGIETDSTNTSPTAMNANLTNELGVEGTVRLLKNVAGMWIISECLREWSDSGEPISIDELVVLASQTSTNARIDPNNPLFLHPGKMVERINFYLRTNNFSEITSKAEIARCVYESLAESYAVA
ncbi:MAG TPA: FGGY family carbohydrate kinase, partial [Candidatus Saccharimonadales bacterium]